MLRRTPFKRARFQPPARAPLQPVRGARKATMAPKQREIVPVLKENALESEAYRRLICTLPCMRCGIFGFTQACHADESKGMGLKTDDRTCWPGCGPHDGKPGCHHYVGTTGALGKLRRRELEREYAEKAIALLRIQTKTDRRVAAVLRSVGLL
jgi:hypothetical protein